MRGWPGWVQSVSLVLLSLRLRIIWSICQFWWGCNKKRERGGIEWGSRHCKVLQTLAPLGLLSRSGWADINAGPTHPLCQLRKWWPWWWWQLNVLDISSVYNGAPRKKRSLTKRKSTVFYKINARGGARGRTGKISKKKKFLNTNIVDIINIK